MTGARSVFLLSAVFILAAMAGPGRSAQQFTSVSELTAQSDAVARARITGVTSAMAKTPEGTFPFIFHQAKTIEAISGQCPADFIVRVPGLISKDRIITTSDSPDLAIGMEAVLFLKKSAGVDPAKNTFDVVGLVFGAVPVVTDPATKDARVVLPVKNSPGPGSRGHVRVKLSDFKTQVRAIRENLKSKEGKP